MNPKLILLTLSLALLLIVSGCNVNRESLTSEGKCKYDSAKIYCEDLGGYFIGGSGNSLFNTFTFDCEVDNIIYEHKIKVFGCQDACISIKQADKIKVLK